MLDSLQFAALERFCKRRKVPSDAADRLTYDSKLDLYFPDWRSAVVACTVVDFGCGSGCEVVELAKSSAHMVYGIEVSERALNQASQRIARAGVADRCRLVSRASECVRADVIFSFDSFEHFADPRAILGQMVLLLKDSGRLYISFGPPWYNAVGGHAFSAFPWAHLVFSEKALVRWRNLYWPGTSEGFNTSGLNRMSIGRFARLCRDSGLVVESWQLVPTGALRWMHNRLTREFTTSMVRVILRKTGGSDAITS